MDGDIGNAYPQADWYDHGKLACGFLAGYCIVWCWIDHVSYLLAGYDVCLDLQKSS